MLSLAAFDKFIVEYTLLLTKFLVEIPRRIDWSRKGTIKTPFWWTKRVRSRFVERRHKSDRSIRRSGRSVAVTTGRGITLLQLNSLGRGPFARQDEASRKEASWWRHAFTDGTAVIPLFLRFILAADYLMRREKSLSLSCNVSLRQYVGAWPSSERELRSTARCKTGILSTCGIIST